MRKTRQHEVVLRFCGGKTPSRIDYEMGFVLGTAHDVVIRWWAGEITVPARWRKDIGPWLEEEDGAGPS
jgi:hypothetical protein